MYRLPIVMPTGKANRGNVSLVPVVDDDSVRVDGVHTPVLPPESVIVGVGNASISTNSGPYGLFSGTSAPLSVRAPHIMQDALIASQLLRVGSPA